LEEKEKKGLKMRRIVVGYDGSEHARRALERVADLAGPEASVTVVGAVRVDAKLAGRGPGPAPLDPEEVRARERALEEARELLAQRGIEARTVEAAGNPADAIADEARALGADLIVVGTRGRSLPQRALLGSVSTSLVHNAPCDVLVVR
jgi:nucleotide-binding universal stress UspA family protein